MSKLLIDDAQTRIDVLDYLVKASEENNMMTYEDMMFLIEAYKVQLQDRITAFTYEADAKADHITSEQFPNG